MTQLYAVRLTGSHVTLSIEQDDAGAIRVIIHDEQFGRAEIPAAVVPELVEHLAEWVVPRVKGERDG